VWEPAARLSLFLSERGLDNPSPLVPVPEMTYNCVEWDQEEGNGKPHSAVFSLDMAVHVIATLYVMNLLAQQTTIEKETP